MTPSQRRASLIVQVRSGQLTAQQAAQQLGISRQAFYKWEKRALKALLHALEDQPPGRPKGTTDPEKDQLKTRVEELERQVRLYEQRDTLRTLLKQMEEPDPPAPPLKKTRNDTTIAGATGTGTPGIFLAGALL